MHALVKKSQIVSLITCDHCEFKKSIFFRISAQCARKGIFLPKSLFIKGVFDLVGLIWIKVMEKLFSCSPNGEKTKHLKGI